MVVRGALPRTPVAHVTALGSEQGQVMTVVARPPSSLGTVKVLLIDPCVVMREGLCALIARQPDLVVVAQADGVRGAAGLDLTPDVIVTDVDLPDREQREAISGLRSLFPHSAILVLSMDEQPATVDAALAAGARGYVLKTASSPELFRGIRALAAGQTYICLLYTSPSPRD